MSVRLTIFEVQDLFGSIQEAIGIPKIVAAITPVLGMEIVSEILSSNIDRKLTDQQTIDLIFSLEPLIPKQTTKEKVLWLMQQARTIFDTDARYIEVRDYVMDSLHTFRLAVENAGKVSTVLPEIGIGTISGYCPVNMWWKMSDAELVRILSRMQEKNVRYFGPEALGNAGEDVLGTPEKMATVKEKYVLCAKECAKRGIWFAPILFNDNAGNGNYSNGGVKLSARMTQAKEFVNWCIGKSEKTNTIFTVVSEQQTAAGKELEAYGSSVLGQAGYTICNYIGSKGGKVANYATYCCYHPDNTGDWPTSRQAHVVSDTGAIIRQLSNGLNGSGNPTALKAWLDAGVARGQAVVAFYAFQQASYDEAAIDAMSMGESEEQEPAGSAWPNELANVKWLHTNVKDWPVTTTVVPSIRGEKIYFPFDKTGVWPSVDGTNANVWAIVNIGGQWYAGTWEWIRPNDPSKSIHCLTQQNGKGDHFKVKPLSSWKPTRGEQFYIMVSGHARNNTRTAKERSDPVKVVWP